MMQMACEDLTACNLSYQSGRVLNLQPLNRTKRLPGVLEVCDTKNN